MGETATVGDQHLRGGGVMRRLNAFTGVVAGIVAAALGWGISRALMSGPYADDRTISIAMVCWILGFLVGVGAFTGPVRWALGRDLTHADEQFMAGKDQGAFRFFRFTTDHKVIGVQYLVLGMVTFGVGGILALLIRTEAARPTSTFGPATYNAIVGLHGIVMVVATIIMIVGPFGNFVMPIMIGARDMAFPRLNALSFWTLFAAVPVLLSAIFLGGIPTGWSAYAPLADQAPPGMDAFLITIILFVVSSGAGAVNLVTTAVTMRARGMTWNRTPIFVWGVAVTSILGLFVMPAFMASQVLEGLDRTIGTSFYIAARGGSPWLYENLFWLMGHPEVYVILLPAVAAIMEITPVFSRKPLFGFSAAIIGEIGIVTLSVFVWAHHMFTTGWAPALNGPFMLTTELISIPTGLLILVIIGTMWRGRIWTRLPMMFVYAFLWNFIIGGITGIYLSDVPVDYQLHGSLFVTAHFHFTLMGGAMMGALAALCFWFPKMTGRMIDERLGKVSFWITQIGFNITFLAIFYIGLQGEPRRVADYPATFATGNLVATIGAYILAIGMLILLYDVIWSWRHGERATSNPWGAKTLEWQVPTPVPLENFEVLPVVTSDPYGYGEPVQPVAASVATGAGPGSPGLADPGRLTP